jgi:membrane associated rhomboid family serine protease
LETIAVDHGVPSASTLPTLAPDDSESALPRPELDDEPEPRAIPMSSGRKAREIALVLQSIPVWHAIRHDFDGISLVVRDDDYVTATRAIARYEEENRNWPPRRTTERLRHARSWGPAWVFLAIAAFMLATGPASGGSRWFSRGASVAHLVLSSEPWRAVTALTLHADSVHVMGNVISGTIFMSAIQRRMGLGAAAFTVLASGVAGNLGNAWFQHLMGRDGHGSIGASTAVFGAVAILAATQLFVDRGTKRSLVDLIAPVIGGLALLGTLGASPESDLGAHLFGFLSGLAIGVVTSPWLVRRDRAPLAGWVQIALGTAALGVVLGSWHLAMRT